MDECSNQLLLPQETWKPVQRPDVTQAVLQSAVTVAVLLHENPEQLMLLAPAEQEAVPPRPVHAASNPSCTCHF